MTIQPVDLLAVMAHPDDAELLCGGTLARSASQGYRVGILDLTRGELGSRGSPELRAREAAEAAAVLGISERANAALPDGHLSNTDATRRTVVGWLRQFRPRTVILQYPVGRHPDHRIASELVRDSCFLAGLKNYPAEGAAFRPEKLCHAFSFREDPVKPTFVVDITEFIEQKLAAIACYSSQFDGVKQAGELYPNGSAFPNLVRTQTAHYGSLIRAGHGEPFWTPETVEIGDLIRIGAPGI